MKTSVSIKLLVMGLLRNKISRNDVHVCLFRKLQAGCTNTSAFCLKNWRSIRYFDHVQYKQFTQFSRKNENWFSAYILRRYCPPTSNKAFVIWPKLHILQTSIKDSKIFSLLIALFCKSLSCSFVSFALCRFFKVLI